MRKGQDWRVAWKEPKIDLDVVVDIINASGIASAAIIAWLNYRRIGNVHKDVLNHVDRKENGDRDASLS